MTFFIQRSSSRLLQLAWLLGTLHCGDEPLILPGPPAPAGDVPVEAGSGEGPTPSGGSTGGAGGGAEAPARGGAGDVGAPSQGPGAGAPSTPPPPGAEPSAGGSTTGECQPRGAGGPFWLVEGDTIQIPIECATGAALSGVTLPNLPANATFDAAARTLTFTPGLDQAGVYALAVGLVGTSERGSIEVQVADRFDAADNVPVDPATYTEELGLPVVHLVADPAINEDGYLPATITYRGHTFTGAEAKYRGQTSLRYPKKSFTLKFTKEDRFGEPALAPGFADKRKITLTTTFDDNSNLRARLAFELWNRVDDGRAKVQTYSAVLYLNGQFWGLYTVTDHVDGRLMEDYGYHQDGNLYKARTHDANFRLTRTEEPGGPKLSLAEGYTKEEGLPLEGEPGASADLEELVSWVATSSSASFGAELEARLARSEYEDWWLLASLIIADDSAGKNSYHYRDPRPGAGDGRFHVVPWDFNDSFGQTYYNDHAGREADRDPEELASYNLFFERLLGEPATRAPLLARCRSLLANEWALPAVLASFDAWAAETEPVARRDESKWGALLASHFAELRSTSGTRHAAEMAYVRQWIVDRWAFVASYC